MPPGAHRYAATGEMLSWDEFVSLLDRLTGRRIRRITVPGWLLRAAGSVGDVVKRVYDFDFPMTRDAMEFTTRWPGADAQRTTRNSDGLPRCRRHPARHAGVDVPRGSSHREARQARGVSGLISVRSAAVSQPCLAHAVHRPPETPRRSRRGRETRSVRSLRVMTKALWNRPAASTASRTCGDARSESG